MREHKPVFWLILDVILVGFASVMTYLNFQDGHAVFALFSLSILWVVWLGAGTKWQRNSRYPQVIRILNVIMTLAFGALCALGALNSGLTVEETASSLPLQLSFNVVMGVLIWLLAQAQKDDRSLASLYRLGIWYSLGSVLVLGIQWARPALLEAYASNVFQVLCVLACIFAADISFTQLRKLKWRRPHAQNNPQALGVLLSLFFSHANPIHSFFETLQRQLGLDFRSSWALLVLRRSFEPILLFSLMLGWLSTAFVTVESHQQAVVERLGVPLDAPLNPGLKVLFPWPIDLVRLVDTERVFSMSIGHESAASDAPVEPVEPEADESILWANQHADEEYTLLLGDGHDLISADGVLQFRIQDPIQYVYAEHHPEARLRAIAYRALMHETVHRTLDDALSENLIELAQAVTQRIQDDAAKHVPCLKPESFTFRALHPPVAVAEAYQSVVSAQIDRQTRIIRAEAYKKARLPNARAEKKSLLSGAEGDALQRKAEAVGEAYAFEGLYATVYSDIELYQFRRAQEALAEQLKGKKVIAIDHRIEKEGATLWIQE